uniref:C2H2-type domain-containing protein n=1 Tax=Anopheles dirus TaxID=7168 RepID=A0A182NBK5_9DIPT
MDHNPFPLWQVSATDPAARGSGSSTVNNTASISTLNYVPNMRAKMKIVNISTQMTRANESGNLYGATTATYLPAVTERQQLVHHQPRRMATIPQNANTMLNESILLQTHDGREYLVDESSIQNIDQIPPENLIYMTTTTTTPTTEEGVLADHLAMNGGDDFEVQSGGQPLDHQQGESVPDLQQSATTTYAEECEVTEEIITDDWVQSQGEECVQVTVDQLGASAIVVEDDIAVPLDQDQYTLSRPYPCDFCSRRFRKKASLQNHLMAHSNDRPHVCNLCGAQYGRRCDLINHLKQHAYAVTEQDELSVRGAGGEQDVDYELPELIPRPDYHQHHQQLKKQRARQSSDDEDMYIQNAMVNYNSQPPMQLISTTNYGSSSSYTNGDSLEQMVDDGGTKVIQQPEPPPLPPMPGTPGRKKVASRTGGYIKKEPLDTAEEPVTSEPTQFPVTTDGRKTFLCQECGISFARYKALVAHTRNHHHHQQQQQQHQYGCDICGALFWEQTLLQDHVRHAHGMTTPEKKFVPPSPGPASPPVKKHFNCDSCSAIFFQLDHLQSHLQQAHGLKRAIASSGKPQRQQELLLMSTRGHADDEEREEEESTDQDEGEEDFEDLDYTYEAYEESRTTDGPDSSQASEVTGSQEQPQQQEFPMACRDCNEMVASAIDLLEHVEMHGNSARYESPHECQLCGEKFFDESFIKRHVQERHRAELTDTSCAICGKRCKSQTTLIKHAWDHSRDRAHSCSKCGKTFHHQARLKRHMDSHRSKAVRCEICSQEFPDGRTLMNHRHSHSKSNEYPCTECGKTFGSRSSQQIHMRIHTGERPYACRFCWKAFADGGTLRKHERIHTGEKPYACPVCPKAFNQRVVLREHIRAHHSQADSKPNSTEKANYCCTVCPSGTTAPFATPRELVQHLIEHSDTNTALQRQPPTFPRKYKRRRKLKPHELERLQSGRRKQKAKPTHDEEEEEQEEEEGEGDEEDDDGNKNLGYGCGGKAPPQHSMLDDNGINLLSNVVLLQQGASGNHSNANRTVTESPPHKKQPPGRAKAEPTTSRMINTTQKRATAGRKTAARQQSSRKRTSSYSRKGAPGKGTCELLKEGEEDEQEQERDDKPLPSNHSAISNVMEALFRGRNRKSMLSEIPSHRISSVSFPLLDDGNTDDPMLDEPSLEENPSSSSTSKQHRGPQHPQRPEDDDLTQQLLMEISRKDKYIERFNSDTVNDLEEILRSPVKPKPSQSAGKRAVKMKSAPAAAAAATGRHRKTTPATGKATAKEAPPQPPPPQVLRSQRLTRRQLVREVNFLKEAYGGTSHEETNPSLTARGESVAPEPNATTSSSPTGGVKMEQAERLAAMLLNDGMMDDDGQKEEYGSDGEYTAAKVLRTVKEERTDSPADDDDEEDTVPEANDLLYGTTSTNASTYRCSICAACFDDRTQLILHVPVHI